MKCQHCKSQRIAKCSAHCSDCFVIEIENYEHMGYVPRELGIGGGDDFCVNICFDCGQVQGKFPKTLDSLKEACTEND